MLTNDEFQILNYVRMNPGKTQRELSDSFSMSLGKVNKIYKKLTENGLISKMAVTESGIGALNPYKVDNAVIMAAGMSSRFAPLSYEKPKGLLVVKGEVLIEREIKQLHEAGITDIIVVVGYMKEKFFYLEEKYGVKIVINDDYYKYNNTSSLIRVLDSINNTYICSSDNYFVDNVFEPYVYRSYYSAVYTDEKTDEYCLHFDKSGLIKKVDFGGEKAWYMLGHVYFDRDFSSKFKKILTEEYPNQKTKEQLWENLYIRYIEELHLYIRKYDSDKVLEFDSLDELRDFDSEYINNIDSAIMSNICYVLNCEKTDICGIKPINSGLTNRSFRFTVNRKEYVYRHPGQGTEKYINRSGEAESMRIVSGMGMDDTYIFMDKASGWKISRYIEDAREMDYHNQQDVEKAIRMIRFLHDSSIEVDYDFDIWKRTEEFIDRLKQEKHFETADSKEHFDLINKVKNLIAKDGYSRKCLCHNDCYSPNFLLDKNNKMYLIDWEYSGNDDPASDLGTFICCSDYTFEEAVGIIKLYLGRDASEGEIVHYLGYVAVAAYYWYVWALYQELKGNPMGEWMYLWHKYSFLYAKKALEYSEKNDSDRR